MVWFTNQSIPQDIEAAFKPLYDSTAPVKQHELYLIRQQIKAIYDFLGVEEKDGIRLERKKK